MLLGESLQEDWSAYIKTCLDSLAEEGEYGVELVDFWQNGSCAFFLF